MRTTTLLLMALSTSPTITAAPALATPAIIGGVIYSRTLGHVIDVGNE